MKYKRTDYTIRKVTASLKCKRIRKTKTDLYRRTRRIGTDGSIESDSLKHTDGRVIISSYNKQGLLTETKEYNKNGELQAYTANKYDDKGRLISSQHQNLLLPILRIRLFHKRCL